jgi:NAD(P)-dependent dehydrogenase (short-subunit alcohol dehydrogenase family)
MLKGLTALVTGSTSGIGLGIATMLASKGANIVLNGFGDVATIESLRARIAGLTKTVALEVAAQGITMNAICPGYVWTPLVERQIPATAKARGITEEQVISDVLLHAQPTKRFVQVDEVAALTAFLASDAGASITGAIIPVDGGWTAQ